MLSGRGPTTDISPFRTFHSWGSSSTLVLSRIAPSFVIRESKATVTSWMSSGKAIGNFRNLYILNGWPFLPSLVWEKKMWRCDSMERRSMTTMVTGSVTRRPTREIMISKNRRIAFVMALISSSQPSVLRRPFSIFCASKKSSSRPISIQVPSWLKTWTGSPAARSVCMRSSKPK